MSKELELSVLFDLYAPLLTQKQQELFSLYYFEDLSLSEIALQCGISRQGVRDSVKRTESQLRAWEEQIGFYQRLARVKQSAVQIQACCRQLLKQQDLSKDTVRELMRMAQLAEELDPWKEEEESYDGF